MIPAPPFPGKPVGCTGPRARREVAGALNDASDADFTILPASIAVVSPNTATTWGIGTPYDIQWTSNSVANVHIELSRNNGADWEDVVVSTDASTGSYSWTPDGPVSNQCLIRISNAAGGGPSDDSDVSFTIAYAGFSAIGAGVTALSHSCMAWGNHDSDGDLDLAISGFAGGTWPSYIYAGDIWENNGDDTFSEISSAYTGVWESCLAWGDCDGDVDLAVVGATDLDPPVSPVGKLYRNDGGTLAEITTFLAVHYCSAAWGDYDNDGDLDLAIEGLSNGPRVTKVYQNDGGGTFTDIGAGFLQTRAGYQYALGWGDFDSNGYLDLAVTGYDGSNRRSKIYANNGGTFVDSGAVIVPTADGRLALGDYNNDGNVDLVVAGNASAGRTTRIYRNDRTAANNPPGAPSNLSTSVSASDVTFSWNASTDVETPQAALTYNLRIGTAPETSDIMPPNSFVGGSFDGQGLVPGMGNVQQNTSWTVKSLLSDTYYWSVQAVDGGHVRGGWATEETVTVP